MVRVDAWDCGLGQVQGPVARTDSAPSPNSLPVPWALGEATTSKVPCLMAFPCRAAGLLQGAGHPLKRGLGQGWDPLNLTFILTSTIIYF